MTDSAAKPEKKKAEAKSEAKESSASDAGSDKTSDSAKSDGSSDASSSYSLGENQKAVTHAYRSNWDDIFGKKPRGKSKK